jgi:S-adenosylmethionine-dependent methyltransferase
LATTDHNSEFDYAPDRARSRVSQFGIWRTEPWTKLRYQLVLGNILRHLPSSKVLRALDVGGGDVFDAIEMAKRGCFVELIDTDERILEAAHRQIETEGVAERVRISKVTPDAAMGGYRGASFNLVFCHRLLDYTPDYKRTLEEASRLLKPEGLLSVVYPNPYATPLRLALKELNPKAALEALIGQRVISAPESAQMNAAIAAAGLQIVADYGVHIFNDYASDEKRNYNPEFFAALLELERAAALLPQYQGIAEYRNVLATKRLQASQQP